MDDPVWINEVEALVGPFMADYILEGQKEAEWIEWKIVGITTNNMAEIAGLLAGLEWSVGRGFQSLEVEGDSQIVLNGIIKQKFKNWKLEAYRPKIQGLCDSLDRYSFKHIYQEGNLAVDWLANSGIDCDGPKQLSNVEELSDGLLSVLTIDKDEIPRSGIR
ncbi:hypothetical protein SUGI_0803600 [Cryptomeria japonica]|nr:hypothetical protein SUGI_0803600 [Cryptomeria japonica]